MKQVAPRAGFWLVRTTLLRSRSQWRLIGVVVAVAILATTLIASLGLLVTATEEGAIRGALARIPAGQTAIDVQVQESIVSIATTRSRVDGAVKSVLRGAATTTSTAAGFSDPDPVSGIDRAESVAYFGEFDNIRSHAKLTAGVWAGKPSRSSTPVDVPAVAAASLGLRIGTEFSLIDGTNTVPVRVVGIYQPSDPSGTDWNLDPLQARGDDPSYRPPGDDFSEASEAFGPLVAAPGAVALAGLHPSVVDVHYRLHFAQTTVDQLAPLVSRLSNAPGVVTLSIGDTAREADYSSNADEAVSGVASGLIVTRSTVIVVSLLLAILAIVAMSQTARLLTDSRAGERQLMRSRGASTGNIVALTIVEGLVLGIITAAVSPVIAGLVYRVLAQQPAMIAAGMPRDAGLPAISWETSAAIALLFVIVLVIPQLRSAGSFVDGQQAKGRPRALGAMRSGLDIAFIIIAAIAYWQLRSYKSPVSSSASIAVDPVLVAGPALVLVAGALLCVRLIPASARVMERIGSGTRGSVVPLAAWEIGRRPQRVTAAVLLLSLSLGVGSFGISFLETWQQSQLDQASLAVGPPARVPANRATADVQASQLARGAVSRPQPVLRATARVSSSGQGQQGPSSDGATATILGLTPVARAMIDRGRLAALGGGQVRSLLHLTASPDSGIDLPGTVRGVSATIRIGSTAVPGVAARVSAILEDAHGLLTTDSLGRVEADGRPHTVSGLLPASSLKDVASPLRLVGLQTTFFAPTSGDGVGGNPATRTDLLISALGVLHATPGTTPTTYSTESVAATSSIHWHAVTADPAAESAATRRTRAGALFDLALVIPANVQMTPASFALVGWEPVDIMAAVLPTAFATRLNANIGDTLTAVVDGVQVHVLLAGTAHLVPGSANADVLTSGSTGLGSSASTAPMIVVDQTLLARNLAQSGITGPEVSEWWVDVAPSRGQAYVSAHPGTDARSSEVLGVGLQDAPLRVATQAALWLAILAGAVLAAAGFVVHSTTTLRARRLELAQLRAIGLSTRKLVGLFAVESGLLAVLGTVFGLSVGLLLVWLVGPLVAVSPDGSPAVPSVIVEIPWARIGLLIVGLAAVLALAVMVVARVQRRVEPGQLLRDGSDL